MMTEVAIFECDFCSTKVTGTSRSIPPYWKMVNLITSQLSGYDFRASIEQGDIHFCGACWEVSPLNKSTLLEVLKKL